MNIKLILPVAVVLLVVAVVYARQQRSPRDGQTQASQSRPVTAIANTAMTDTNPIAKIVHTDAEWQKLLTPEEYKILRNKGTEPAFCGAFYNSHEPGTYNCAACDLDLFVSDAKFDSGTGWPSFFQAIAPNRVLLHEDNSYGMHRTEVLCARCDSHLGHVFDDGPAPTHQRFCMNSVALKFVPKAAKK